MTKEQVGPGFESIKVLAEGAVRPIERYPDTNLTPEHTERIWNG